MKTREQIDAEALEKAHAAYLHTSLAGIAGERFNDAGVCLRAAIAAYEAALWQPIEDAPRDGTEVLTKREHHFHASLDIWTVFGPGDGDYGWMIGTTHFRYPPKPPENI